MNPRPIVVLLLLAAGLLPIGCRASAFDRHPPTAAEPTQDRSLDQGYAILLGLLADEARLDGLLALKSPRPGVASIIRTIADTAREDRAWLTSRLSSPPQVDPRSTDLPALESEARRRIERAETPNLLLSGGRTFETRVLLTQQKATQYAGALCAGLAELDPDAERSAGLKAMAGRWEDLERTIRRWITVVDPPPSGDADRL